MLGEEQAALRRVATLVARGVPPAEVFAAVTEEVARLFSAEYAGLSRFESDGTMTIVAGSGRRGDQVPVGRRWSLGGRNINTLVFETGRPARIDGYADASGPLGVTAREHGVGSSVGTPVIVEGRLWGVMATYSTPAQLLSADTEARLANFTELLATAIANAESRAELSRLAEEQAVLRRIAMLVARGVPPEEVFAAVTEEAGRLLGASFAGLARYDSDATVLRGVFGVVGVTIGRAPEVAPRRRVGVPRDARGDVEGRVRGVAEHDDACCEAPQHDERIRERASADNRDNCPPADPSTGAQTAPAETNGDEEQQRPEKVELLLDAQ